jgi:ferredoxin-NADP reductase
VLSVRPDSARCVRIALRPPDWSGHVPGQHVDVRLTAPDGYTAQRSYSIASAPEQPTVDLVVERLPGGEVSSYLADVLERGDELELRGPIGGYFVWPAAPDGPVQLVAGGSGVVPMLGMLAHHRLTGSPVPLQLLYSARAHDDVIGEEELAHAGADVLVTVTYTRQAPEGWSGPTGRIDEELLAAHAVPPGQRPLVLVCGPTPFVEVVTEALTSLGHAPERIKTERFGGMGGPE